MVQQKEIQNSDHIARVYMKLSQKEKQQSMLVKGSTDLRKILLHSF